MIEQHYGGVIANWDGNQVPADQQSRPRVILLDAEWTR
jgi:hypothetical protein